MMKLYSFDELYSLIEEQHRLEDIGEALIESFIYIKHDSRDNLLKRYLIESSRSKHSSNKPANQNFAVQRQNNNRQLQRLQNTGNLQRALNTGRQAAGSQNTQNLFIDTFTPVQRYNDLVGGSNPFFSAQDVEISPQNTQYSMHLFSGFFFT
ncbi:41728_t:CDS:2 [Gigaspora margarita]|uniref:41728_t:CDS:1 n=1 Tax=Gigaspora margarita TaxID=4874 RepID=A0ABM8VYM7_GIGMA|nr:41728_t:CDS:2 [Gigaspora margarita]